MLTAVAMLGLVMFAGLPMQNVATSSDQNFERGLNALAARDFTTALRDLELAVTADPDNLRYGAEYRRAAIQAQQFDRSIHFFENLVAVNARSANAFLNYGFAFVDKIPTAGWLERAVLSNSAVKQFSMSLKLKPSWVAFFARGKTYLFWPKISNRASLAAADLERAMTIQKAEKPRYYHVQTFVCLGDAYWKMDDLNRARAVWKEGLDQFPESSDLKARLSNEGAKLKALITDALDSKKRVNTYLRGIWSNP